MPSLNDVTPYFGGQTAQNPANVLEFDSVPSSAAIGNKIGTIAVDTSTSTGYILTSLSGGVATWSQMGAAGGGSVNTLTGNSGGAVTASAANINVIGSGVLAFAGSGSTLTGSITPGSSLVAQMTGNSGGALSPASGVMNVVGTGAISVAGSGNTLTISTSASGTVTSVSGTAGQIVSTGGATPVISIDPAYVGQASITTLGTITTGTWSGTAIGAIKGGTGLTSYNVGDTLYCSSSNTLSKLSVGTNGQVLTVASGVPSWAAPSGGISSVSGTLDRITSTGGTTPVIDIAATYVGQSSITNVGILTAGAWNADTIAASYGGTGISTYTAGDILYASGTSTLSKLAAGTNGDVLTLASGLPSWAAPSGGGVSSVSGTANRISSTGGTTPIIDIDAAYEGQTSIVTLGTITTGVWTGTAIGATRGGTGLTSYTTGDILYASATNTLSKLAAGSNGQFLTLSSGIPAWGSSVTLAAFGSSPNANGLSLSGSTLNMQPASASFPGGVSTGTQTIAGAKTFSTSLSTPSFALTGSGSGTISVLPQAAAGTYNFNLPTSAGTSGQVLTSAGGGSSPMTWSTPITGTATQFRVLVGGASNNITSLSSAGTAGQILQSGGAAADPTFSTATYPSTTTANQLLYSSATNTVAGLTNGTTGQVLLATTGGAPSWGSAMSVAGDTGGTLTGLSITTKTNQASRTCGSTLKFAGSGTTLTLNVTDATFNTQIGNSAGSLTQSGSNNTALGYVSQTALTSGSNNNAVGYFSLVAVTSGSDNQAFGSNALDSVTSGSRNIGIGSSTLQGITGISDCIAIGHNSLTTASSGARNHGIGSYSLDAVTSGNDNIAIGYNAGTEITNGDYNIAIGNYALDVVDTGGNNIAIGYSALSAGNSSDSIAIGYQSMATGSGSRSVSIGSQAMGTATTGDDNIAIGYQSLYALAGGSANIGMGPASLIDLTTGIGNTGLGSNALNGITTGSYNVSVGFGAGNVYASSESSNICLNNIGILGESNTLRIGAATGTGNQELNASYICGIDGINVTGSAVLVSTSNQLGITVSSRKYKDNIQDMDLFSDSILKLRPVTFTMKGDDKIVPGLIAEEVAEVMPGLVVYDKKGEPQTVKYHEMPSLLLNELKKALARIEALEAKINV